MTLFLVGGAPSENLSDVHDVFAASVGARARGRTPRVALVVAGPPEQISRHTPFYLEPLRARLPECEVVEVHLPPASAPGAPDEPAPIDDTAWPDDLANLDGIIVGGGHTPSYLAGLAPRRNELARLVREDVPWLGFSAGAMVTARHALIGGWQLDGVQIGNRDWSEDLDELTVVDGLALVTPLIATHNNTMQADALVLAALDRDLARQAVAIDEDTCLVVDPISGRTAHYGRGRLRWFTREGGSVEVTTQHPDA